MYNRLYNSLEMNIKKYSLKMCRLQLAVWFQKVREQLASRNFAYGIFVDLQKAFDSVDHEILIHTKPESL